MGFVNFDYFLTWWFFDLVVLLLFGWVGWVCLIVVFDAGGVLGFDLFGVCVLLGLLVCFGWLSFWFEFGGLGLWLDEMLCGCF